MYEFYAGCDTHKEKHFISIINQKGEIQKSFEVENSENGCKKAISEVSYYSNLIWGIENSQSFARKFCESLINSGQTLKEINPIFTGKSRKASTNKNKTDLIDSVVIARILRDEIEYLPNIQTNIIQVELKMIIRQREEMVKEQTRSINRLHAKLVNFDPQYKNLYSNLKTLKSLNFWESKLNKSDDILKKLILQEIRYLKNVQKEISNLNKMLSEKQNENTLIQNLITLTGINTTNACKLVSLVGNIARFKTPNHLASFAGIPPVEKSSGKGTKRFRNIGGNRHLNTVFYQIALTQIRYDPIARAYYEKKLESGKTKKQALHCLMRRLVNIIWMMYKHNQPYSYVKKEEIIVAA